MRGTLGVLPMWALFSAVASSMPLSTTIVDAPVLEGLPHNLKYPPYDEGTKYGDPPEYRTGFLVMAMFCTSVIGGMIGFRLRYLDREAIKAFTLTHYLVFIQYFIGMGFVLSAAILETGMGLASLEICEVAINVCLGFYASSKVLLYLFLVERAHALRASKKCRLHDWLWVIPTTLIIIGFGSIAIVGFFYANDAINPADNLCHIGLPRTVTIPLLCFDVLIQVILTFSFIYLLGPVIRLNDISGSRRIASRLASAASNCDWFRRRRGGLVVHNLGNPQVARRIEKLLWRTFIGSCLVLFPTVANMIQLTILHGRERGFICLTLCTLDVIWAICVLHWLMNSTVAEVKPLPRQRTNRADTPESIAAHPPTKAPTKPPAQMPSVSSLGISLDSPGKTDSFSAEGLDRSTDLTPVPRTPASRRGSYFHR